MRHHYLCLILLSFLNSGCKDSDLTADLGPTIEVDWPSGKKGIGRAVKEWTPTQLTQLGWDGLSDWPKECKHDEQLTNSWLLVDDLSRSEPLGILLGSSHWPTPPLDSVVYNGRFLNRWSSLERDTIFGWHNGDHAYLSGSRATLEGLVDRRDNNRQGLIRLPGTIPDSAEYYLLPRGDALFPNELNVVENTLGLLLLPNGEIRCSAKVTTAESPTGLPADWLSVLPASVEGIVLGVGGKNEFRAFVQMGQGQLVGTQDISVEQPTSTRRYLNIPVWRENENHLGFDSDNSQTFWHYANVDGITWQATNESVLFQMIRRSLGRSNRLLDLAEVNDNLAQLAEAQWVIMGQLPYNGKLQSIWLYPEGDQLEGFHIGPPRLTNLPDVERDLGGQLKYLDVDPHVGIWLAQTSGGRIWVGDGSQSQSIGFQDPVLAGPFSPDGIKTIWQTSYYVYSLEGARLDSVAVSSEWPMRFHYAAVESKHYFLVVDTVGRLRRLEESLSIDPSWQTDESSGKVIATPAILTGSGTGAQYLGLNQEGSLLGWKNRGALAWKIERPGVRLPEKSWLRSSLSLAASDDLSVYVSEDDPDRPLYFPGKEGNNLVALPGKKDSMLLINHQGKWRKQSVPGQSPIKDAMVLPGEVNGEVLLLLRREANIMAIDTLATIKWQLPLVSTGSRLFRTGGGRYWGLYDREKSRAQLYRGKKAMTSQAFRTDVQPVYDPLNDYWMISRNGLLLFVKDLEGYTTGE